MIASKEYVMNKCSEYGIFPSKKYGQNFLIQEEPVNQASSALEINAQDVILEIGPGLGALSEKIKDAHVETHLFDIDPNMVGHLTRTFAPFSWVHVHQTDFLKLKWEGKCKIIGNLPYYITTPLIEHVLLNFNCSIFVFMVQQEVEERLFAKKGTKEYGPLSLLIEATCQHEKVCKVHRTSFYPVPHVDSAIYKLTRTHTIDASFYRFLNTMFSMRRKTILNNLLKYVSVKEKAIEFLEIAQISSLSRPEELSLEDFQKLYQIVVSAK